MGWSDKVVVVRRATKPGQADRQAGDDQLIDSGDPSRRHGVGMLKYLAIYLWTYHTSAN